MKRLSATARSCAARAVQLRVLTARPSSPSPKTRSIVDINTLPAGARGLVDANIFIYHLADASPDCTNFIDRARRGRLRSICDDDHHRRSAASSLSDYITEVEDLLLLPFSIVEAAPADIKASHALRQAHGLFVNDSINLACAARFGITDVVTHDSDFARVALINVWSPTDI
jgi:predicted nucleic acid-binding protein